MSQTEKAAYFNALKAAGVMFDRHYREYSTAELKAACDKLVENNPALAAKVGLINPPPSDDDGCGGEHSPASNPGCIMRPANPVTPPKTSADPEAAAFFGFDAPSPAPNPAPTAPSIPVARRDPNEMAGARLNTQPKDEPIRIDPDTGVAWYQEEVRKPAYPKPRGRRILRKRDAAAVKQTVKAGDYTETFEVSGDPRNLQDTEVKITLPSYQVGIYNDPRYPFRVVCYNGNEGFHRDDVIAFWGGAELVPSWIKRKYVENYLCYDMRSVIQQIQSEYRELQLNRGRR